MCSIRWICPQYQYSPHPRFSLSCYRVPERNQASVRQIINILQIFKLQHWIFEFLKAFDIDNIINKSV
jgi:hypothetical protein